MSQPRILVGCPVSDYHAYCTDEYLARAQALSYPKYTLFLADNSRTDTFSSYLRSKRVDFVHNFSTVTDVKEKIMLSRNALRKKVLDEGYDYFFSLEQDVIPPVDVLEQLLRHKKPIVSGVYYSYFPVQGRKMLFPVLYRALTPEEQATMRQQLPLLEKVNPELHAELIRTNFDFSQVRVKVKPEEAEQPRLMTVKQAGLGCMLIHRDVLAKISFRVDQENHTYDDALFCEDARSLGYELFVDTSVKCKHLLTKRPWQWKQLDSRA